MTSRTLTAPITSLRVRAAIAPLMAAGILNACAADTSTGPRARELGQASSTLTKSICALHQFQVPDLVVTAVSAGAPTATGVVPITASIKNVGAGCAGTFRIEGEERVGTSLTGARLDVDPTTVVDANGSTLRSIEPGEIVTITGRVTLPVFTHNASSVFNILADGCAYVGDEFLPTYCRVKETNEGNNKLQSTVTIP